MCACVYVYVCKRVHVCVIISCTSHTYIRCISYAQKKLCDFVVVFIRALCSWLSGEYADCTDGCKMIDVWVKCVSVTICAGHQSTYTHSTDSPNSVDTVVGTEFYHKTQFQPQCQPPVKPNVPCGCLSSTSWNLSAFTLYMRAQD